MPSVTPTFTPVDFFYDEQIKRYLLQVIRAFSGFQYQSGVLADGTQQLRVVPCRMATQNRQVGYILQNNSENTMTSCPMITVFIKGVELNRDRTQSPSHISTVHVNERAVDPATGAYTSELGHQYSVSRMMPHPLDVTLQVDVWTSNELQKHQLFEQIFMMFNVGFEIQNSDNAVDWSAKTTMTLNDITWSSRAIPIGTSSEIDILTFTFKLPMWISPPAIVKQQRLIHQVVTNIHNDSTQIYHDQDHADALPDAAGYESGGGVGGQLQRVITTPGDFQISIVGDTITLLGADGEETDKDGNIYSWATLLQKYGTLVPAHSTLRLMHSIEDGYSNLDVIGSIQYGSQPNELIWQVEVDTLPGNTLGAINAIINPLTTYPGKILPNGSAFPAAALGQRYMITEDVAGGNAWGNHINASAGDIIENTPLGWMISFDASQADTVQFVANLSSGAQLKFDPQAGRWQMAIDGVYFPGYWRLQL
jgi:hypothetical protein